MSALDEHAVLVLGQHWMDRLLPSRTNLRVFLAGGAFKTLIHGGMPRDLDLFCPDAASRQDLIAALHQRGAQMVRDNPPYQAALTLDGLLVEVAYDTTKPTLEERLACSDLALSAVGCEFGSTLNRALVHPLARVSVSERQVLLLKPLMNWKYALYTLERMYRYAEELGFSVPAEEEAHVWATFAAQTPGEQQAMLRRYERVSSGCQAICARAAAIHRASVESHA